MARRIQIRRTACRITTLLAAAALCGCGATPPAVNDTLDPLTGVTITSSSTPLVMYRDEPSRAAYARNFLHVGPLQINRSGDYQYFLWVVMWSTTPTTDVTASQNGFDSIILFVDGEPLPLDASGWTPAAIGTSEHVYVKPVASTLDAYYRVTTDQIRLIAESSDIRLRTTGSSPRNFELWDEQTSAREALRAFLREVFL